MSDIVPSSPAILSFSARRKLSKRLSALLAMSATDALSASSGIYPPRARRIGFSGPPGAGKSSLIAAWVKSAPQRRVGMLAVDPSSPISGGSLLGDRIRMDEVTSAPDFFLRSVASRSSHDGLCPNAAALLDALEEAGFEDVVLETVGVGQAEYAARVLVDTFVIVLGPQTGDVVQAMKAGILETADIFVVNKADLPGAERSVSELSGVVSLRGTGVWRPPVIAVSVMQRTGLEALENAVAAHSAIARRSEAERRRERRRFCLRSALLAQIDAQMASLAPSELDAPLEDTVMRLLDGVRREFSGVA